MFSFLKTRYDYLIPPLAKSIFDLTPAEAEAYFTWYMEKLPERVAYISRICARELHIRRERMDCSPESLILLWKWFRRRAEKQPGPTPQNPKQKVLTPETELLLQDVGMYLGETLCKMDLLYRTEKRLFLQPASAHRLRGYDQRQALPGCFSARSHGRHPGPEAPWAGVG